MLPNELLLNICQYFSARELYRALYPLNHRFRSIVDSMPSLHLTMTNNECHAPVWLAYPRVFKLSIEQVKHIDFHKFSSIRSLKWISPSDAQMRQIHSSIYLFHLCQLSIYNMPNTPATAYLHQCIFSNGFPHLRKCILDHVDTKFVWTQSPSLRAVSIGSLSDSLVFERILLSCPNLTRLDFRVIRRIVTSSSLTCQHINLKRLYLMGNISLQSVDIILACLPCLVYLSVKWTVREHLATYFQHLSNTFNVYLPYLHRFDCEFLYNGHYEDLIKIKSTLERLHPCFTHHLQITKLSYGRVRIYTT
ncbi:unnamed protein product [Adineta steineri]|uniref:F-box domain-containing protein n=1 Tax=Adineta steineri TaxID=433720 RepID=A0A813SD73_9BILA|nr:unnamed protein product [Adineta steineri]